MKDGRWRQLYKSHLRTVVGKRSVHPNWYMLSQSNGGSDDSGLRPVANASKLDVLACAVLRLHGLDPSDSGLLRRLEVIVLPSLKVKVWVAQRCQGVFRDRVLQGLP